MVKEAYVSFEVAKLLKEKGFDEPCYMSYWLRTKDNIEFVHLEQSGNKYSNCLYAPTHQLAMAWIRGKGYHIYSFYLRDWNFAIQKLDEDWELHKSGYNSYEEAVEEALKCALENLI